MSKNLKKMNKLCKSVCFVLLFYLFIGTGQAEDTPQEDEVSIIYSEDPIFLKIGEKRVLFCKGTAEEKNWYDPRGERVLGKIQNLRIHVERKKDQVILMFADLNLDDNGTWTCASPNVKKTIDIYIVEDVTFEGMKKEESPVEGSRLELECRGRGVPTPSLMWFKDGVLLSGTTNRYRVNDGRLRIERIHREDSGEYECKAIQKVGSIYFHVSSAKTLVQVQHRPIMEHDSVVEVYVIMNETKTLRCIATAYPKPTYRWKKSDDRSSFDTDTDNQAVTAEDGSYSELDVEIRHMGDLSSYTCIASNTLGKNKTKFHLQLGNKPQPLDQVKFISATNETMEFEVLCTNCTTLPDPAYSPSSDNLPVTHYRFELVNSTDEVDWSNVSVIAVELERTNETHYTVEGLQPETTYQIRVASVNSAGFSEFTSIPPQATTSRAIRIACSALLLISMGFLSRVFVK